ncbi:MAG: cytochrome-c oxidase, cbb3-type subunit III [Paucibacter sp.]|nr:cytochrome-c oxidase, cbb3-type subunit III [Roseateles sp.]
MSEQKRDDYTGQMDTGHEWNGIRELNTAVPRPVWFFLILTFLFGVGYWVLMPSWPFWTGYVHGLLGIDQKKSVAERIEQANAHLPDWVAQVKAKDFAEIQADPALMADVIERGHELFGDNCAACHGVGGRGNRGFPALAAGAWLWGGDPATVFETIRVGVNSASPETRSSQMPAFGKDQLLEKDDILKAIAYVRSLSGLSHDAALAEAGKDVFANNCVGCHGDEAKGSHDTGAPDLTDQIWLYGNEPETMYRTVFYGRQGHMPNWDQRLSDFERKVLTLYVINLSKGGKS